MPDINNEDVGRWCIAVRRKERKNAPSDWVESLKKHPNVKIIGDEPEADVGYGMLDGNFESMRAVKIAFPFLIIEPPIHFEPAAVRTQAAVLPDVDRTDELIDIKADEMAVNVLKKYMTLYPGIAINTGLALYNNLDQGSAIAIRLIADDAATATQVILDIILETEGFYAGIPLNIEFTETKNIIW